FVDSIRDCLGTVQRVYYMIRYAARRVLSTVAARNIEASSSIPDHISGPYDDEKPVTYNQNLCLFPAPKVVVPNFELTRKVGTFCCQGIYQFWFERAYNKERFIHAANEGISVIGECIANKEWNRLSVVASTDLVEQIKPARRKCTNDQLNMLKFHPNDAILSFLHNSLISVRNYLTKDVDGVVVIYFTVVSFIRMNSSVPYEATITQLLNKYKNDVIVSNVTFARNLIPLGQWRATAVNFFSLHDAGGSQ
ncbi:hypothetical protein V3C99_009322, partial [Haemonchus contortus]|uniref:Guanylate cyclase domain-containing protein n=1 Tax=Haemonchus contortus TaxID=6289 RepID=A0A7I4YKP4_HAECO